MKTLLCCFAFCIGATLAQFMPQGMPQPMPMPMPDGMGGMGGGGMGGPGMGGMGFNPFTGPMQSRGMDNGMNQNFNRPPQNNNNNRDNNNNGLNQQGNDTANANDVDGQNKNKNKPAQQPRSGQEAMLDDMGLHGIQDFYSALTGELARNPSGFQGQPHGDPQDKMGY